LLEATPVGHSGARVDVHERPAWAISGWAGVVVVAAGMAIAVLIAGSTWIIAPIVVGALVATSLVIGQPGQTKVVRFFGSYVETVRRNRPVVDRATGGSAEPEHSGQELRDQPSEGQRRRPPQPKAWLIELPMRARLDALVELVERVRVPGADEGEGVALLVLREGE
jgi:hypothetical protein